MEHLGFPIETVIIFVVVVAGSLFLDLFAHKKDEDISLRSACLWSLFWVAVSVAFGGYLYFHHGSEMASLYFTGYVLEKVLSVDNLFVIMAVFSWFSIPNQFRHRVLYWGVVGAIVFRAIFVAIGAGLMALGPFVELVFAAMVAYTGVMMLKKGEEKEEVEDYSSHVACRWVRRVFPVWPRLHGHDFFLSRAHAQEEAARLGLTAVERLEVRLVHDHFPADFKHVRRSLQGERNRSNRAHVFGDVLAHQSVAARGGAHKPTLFIAQRRSKSVELQFAVVAHRRIRFLKPQIPADARIKRAGAFG